MDFRHPFHVIAPTLDGDVLTVLAGAEEEFSGRRMHQVLGYGSEQGVRNAAERLVEQGIVSRRQVGKAKTYRLNRQHISASHVEGIAAAKGELVSRLRACLESWRIPPLSAFLFGSVARSEATLHSDLDLLVIRRLEVEDDAPEWLEQLATLEREATEWTGNDTRVLEYDEGELTDQDVAAVVEEAISEGIAIFGSRRRLRNAIKELAR